jgi:hypothetical protein
MSRNGLRALVLALVVAALTVPLGAGARATLILASGERVRGVLVGMSGGQFTVRDGNTDVSVPVANVAVVDFVGGGQGIPGTETSKMEEGNHLVFQRGGDYFLGRLVEMRGDTPLRLVFSTPDGNIEMNADEIGRVYLRRWEGMPGR